VKAYGIFQGGGAKGYAHVGALKAAEALEIEFVRCAGTSAGALIAALATAGYSADEMLDPEKPLGERGVLDVEIADLLDAREYDHVKRVRAKLKLFGEQDERGAGVGVGRWWRRTKRDNPILVFLRGVKLIIGEIGVASRLRRDFGMTGTERIVDWLDGLLRRKVPGEGPVTFGQLGMRLRVVAANLRTGEVHVFGRAGHEDECVAPAVMASACFPLFFRPFRIRDEMFVDGGLVSNLPAWLFDEEREDDPSFLPTFGFRLINDLLIATEAVTPASFFAFMRRMVQTLQSGARNLEVRRIEDFHGIDLRARVGTLSFDTARSKAAELVREGRLSVEKYFEEEIGPRDPDLMGRVLKLIVDELIRHYDWGGERVRASVILKSRDGRYATTVYSGHMDGDPDDRLRVRTASLGAGTAIRLREPVVIDRDRIAPDALDLSKYEMKARPADIRHMYVLPIFERHAEWDQPDPMLRAEPFAALVIDRETAFGPLLLDPDQQDGLAGLGAIVGEEMRGRQIVPVESDTEEEPSPEERERAAEHQWERERVTGHRDLDAAGAVRVSNRKRRRIGVSDLERRVATLVLRAGAAQKKPRASTSDYYAPFPLTGGSG